MLHVVYFDKAQKPRDYDMRICIYFLIKSNNKSPLISLNLTPHLKTIFTVLGPTHINTRRRVAACCDVVSWKSTTCIVKIHDTDTRVVKSMGPVFSCLFFMRFLNYNKNTSSAVHISGATVAFFSCIVLRCYVKS